MTEQKKVRVRFAPSPTGNLHVGGSRTALFNYLYARRQKGTYILRIEDTDTERSKPEFLDEILDSHKWLGMDWDELYHQSERLELYRQKAQELLDSGKAYRSVERESDEGAEGRKRSGRQKKVEASTEVPAADEETGEAIYFRVPDMPVFFYDLIHDKIEFDSALIEDFVIVRSNGMATYNFACVVDDIDMGITHVIRGDDHISNTPRQLALYAAFGVKPPKFAHMPLTMGTDGKRLSKRHGATAITDYRRMGFLPEGLLNFLALLGWSPGGDREIMTVEEMVKLYSMKRMKKTSTIFDRDKLNWINGEHIKGAGTSRLVELLLPFLEERQLAGEVDRPRIAKAIELFKGRFDTLVLFCERADYLFADHYEFEKEPQEEHLQDPQALKNLTVLAERLEGLEEFTVSNIEPVMRGLADELGLKAGELIHPARVAITGKGISPGIFEVMEFVGKEACVRRLRRAGGAAKDTQVT
jgi:glutamyl-tRNA synthetase